MYAQVRRDLTRILAEVAWPEPADYFDPDQRRREINALWSAALQLRPERPELVRQLEALRWRLIGELRGRAPRAAAPFPRSSAELPTQGAPGAEGER